MLTLPVMATKRVKTSGGRVRLVSGKRKGLNVVLFTAYLSPEIVVWIEDQAEAQGLSRSAWLRQVFQLMKVGTGALAQGKDAPLFAEMGEVIEAAVQRAIDARVQLDRRQAQLVAGKRRA